MPQRARPRFDAGRNQWTFFYKKKRRYLCAGAANEALAWEIAERIRGPAGDIAPPRTVTEAADAWLKQRGTKWHEHILAPLLRYGVRHRLSQVHAEYLDDYLRHLEKSHYVRLFKRAGKQVRQERAYKPVTLRRQVSLAHTILDWAHKRSYMKPPTPPLPRLPRVAEVDRSIPHTDVSRLQAELPKYAFDILTFVALTGCRPEEACLLTHAELNETHAELHRGKTWKSTGRPRVIYLSEAARKVIDRQPTTSGVVFLNRLGKPHRPAGLRSTLRRAARRAGLKKVTTYTLRHSYAQDALDRNPGVTLDDVGEALGHVPGSRSTRIYARIRAARAAKAVQGLAPVVSPERVPPAPDQTLHEPGKTRKTGQRSPRKTDKVRGRRKVG